MAARTRLLCQDIQQFITDNGLLIDVKSLVVGEKLSEGFSSCVHRGRYEEADVAVKIMQPPLGCPVAFDLMSKFCREVRLLNRGRHDNVVRLIGASVEPTLLIVTELMQGGSLKSYLWNMRPHPPDLQQSIRFALDISRALAHLHADNIIHRDLKPGNLVLAADKNSLKVADFGLAQVGNDVKYMIYESGNIRWTAPELITKVNKITKVRIPLALTHKVDIFSFSIVLYELLTNKIPPFKIKSRNGSRTKTESLEELPDSVPRELIHLLETCWAEKPDMRPEFAEIVVELTDILNALP